ncbi:hypothetical protein ILYODFUR_036320 [Ilyodon furcidens]|uniref:Uncharacterized protein n=1 Tax=Ilyodon furcidens TaxID=33524 RepID=A0ABV0T6U9_9TELE
MATTMLRSVFVKVNLEEAEKSIQIQRTLIQETSSSAFYLWAMSCTFHLISDDVRLLSIKHFLCSPLPISAFSSNSPLIHYHLADSMSCNSSSCFVQQRQQR